MNANEFRAKSTDELNKELLDLLKAQFGLRMQIATQQLTTTARLGRSVKTLLVCVLFFVKGRQNNERCEKRAYAGRPRRQ